MATIARLSNKFHTSQTSYYRHALQEQWLQNGWARYVVYGHTHHHEVVPLDSFYGRAGRTDQIYFNSGTWRRVFEQTKKNPNEALFIPNNVMTFLAFYKKGERGGRSFESWSGSLSVDSNGN